MHETEKLREAQEYIKRLRKQIEQIEGDAMRYRRLRQLEVIIMAEDGAKYLKKGELDVYIDTLPHSTSRAEILKELLPGLNNLFGMEYDKYKANHKEAFK